MGSNAPAIRFAGFEGPWERTRLGDVADIVGGGTPDTNNPDFWNGDIDWYSPAELDGSVFARGSERKITKKGLLASSATMLPAGRTILFSSRAGIGSAAILNHDACTNQGFQSIVARGDVDVYFLYAMTTKIKRWAESKAAGSTFIEISGKQLAEMNMDIPSLPEQRAIGSLFSALDALIEAEGDRLAALRTTRESMLARMFPREGESVPEVRFAGFEGPWERKRLGDVTDKVTRKNEGNACSLPLTISSQFGLVDQREFFSKQVASKDMSGYYLLRQGEFAYNKSTSNESPWGAVRRLTRYAEGCVSTLYICFAANNVDPAYLTTYYKTNLWHRDVQLIAAEGARNHGLLNIAPADFFDTKILVPSLPEQRAIGSFFSRLDAHIEARAMRVEALGRVRGALLARMFG